MLKRGRKIPATYDVGFNHLAFQGLINLINADPHLYFYYGSETTPPCREEVLWMVFGEPRSLSKPQFDFLLLLLAKHKKKGKKVTDALTPNQLFGNKRSLILFDENLRGKILSNTLGIKHVSKGNFFKNLS